MSGSIEERRPGVWRVRVSAGVDQVTGKRRVITRTVKGDRAAAELVRARLLVECSDGAHMGTNATVADLFDAWLPQAQLSEAARYDYGLVIAKHINPRIGRLPLAKVKPYTLDRLYSDLEADGVSPIRLRKVHTVLRSAFRRAVKWEWITRNPALDPDLPDLPDHEITPPTPAQLRDLFAAAEGDQRATLILHLAGTVGCRRGELCGLQWGDIDLDEATITIRRSVGVIGGQPVIKTTKTGRAREVPIGAHLVELLRRYRLSTAAARLAAEGDWVFPSTAPGGFAPPDGVSRLFRNLVEVADLPEGTRLHDLRHYVATQLRGVGIITSIVSKRLGHSRESTTTDIYSHTDKAGPAARDAADTIERINRGEDETGT